MDEEKPQKKSQKEERIRAIATSYYSRQDIRKAIFDFSKNREVVPLYFEGFGKRPDALQYESDLLAFVRKGATSFHCSEEIWRDPLEISTEMSQEQFNELRQGWDLLIDIDSKYLDYSKVSCSLIIKALEFHGVRNIGVKFSGSKGFHIIVPWKAFPKQIYDNETKKMFPEWPRMISLYINFLIKDQLLEKLSDLFDKERKTYIKDFEASEKVAPDIVLVSSRHLFRMPYSLHEKTSLSSVVIDKDKVLDFEIKDANPLRVQINNFYPEAREGEASELLLQAMDWWKSNQEKQEREEMQKKKQTKQKTGKEGYKEVVIKDLTPNLFPPCIDNISKGIKEDGRKRALFILINFFKSLKLSQEGIETRINDWNNKNYKPLNQGYIKSQLLWHSRQKTVLPPNCDKTHYKDLGICNPDSICGKIKNPVNYTIKKSFFNKNFQKKTKK